MKASINIILDQTYTNSACYLKAQPYNFDIFQIEYVAIVDQNKEIIKEDE